MHAPWYVYLFGILVAIPVYILWAVGAAVLGKFFFSWMTMPDTPKPPSPKVAAKG